MKLDEALREAYRRELDAAPYRAPGEAELASALSGAPLPSARLAGQNALGSADGLAAWRHSARRRAAELAPILALAAALIAAVRLEPETMLALRPLAKEFSSAIPEGSGYRFYDFVIEAGGAYRSSKRSM